MFGGFVVWDSRVPRACSCCYPVLGVTLWPFIFLAITRPGDTSIKSRTRRGSQEERAWALEVATIVRHERIHIAQATETLVLPFYLLWLFDLLRGRLLYGSFQDAYFSSRLEQEAFEHEDDEAYLARRRLFAWRAYPLESVARRLARRHHRYTLRSQTEDDDVIF